VKCSTIQYAKETLHSGHKMSGWKLLITTEQSQTETTVCQLPFGKYLEDHMDKQQQQRPFNGL